jgi:hypothetical protein
MLAAGSYVLHFDRKMSDESSVKAESDKNEELNKKTVMGLLRHGKYESLPLSFPTPALPGSGSRVHSSLSISGFIKDLAKPPLGSAR